MVASNAGPAKPRGRVCVLACQRLGDLLTAFATVARMRAEADVETIDLLHFRQTRGAAQLLLGVDRRIEVDYLELKAAQRIHPLAGYARLQSQLEEAGCIDQYDSCVVWGPTPFACHLAPVITRMQGAGIFGVHYDHRGRLSRPNAYARYINEVASRPLASSFALQDLYARSCGFEAGPAPAWTGASVESATPRVALQVLSSDRNKDWWPGDHSRWRDFANALARATGCAFVLLGAPSQADELSELARQISAPVDVHTGDLVSTAAIMVGCQGLVSVDTVAIHMAALVNIPCVVLRLGVARGHAFLPGAQTLCVEAFSRMSGEFGDACDESERIGIDDLVTCTRAHLFEDCPDALHRAELAQRLWIRSCVHTADGSRGLASPNWIEAGPIQRRIQAAQAAWQQTLQSALAADDAAPLAELWATAGEHAHVYAGREALLKVFPQLAMSSGVAA